MKEKPTKYTFKDNNYTKLQKQKEKTNNSKMNDKMQTEPINIVYC